MRIGIDLMSFRPGRMGGTEVHMRNLLENLLKIDSKNDYLVLMNSANKDSVDVSGKANFRKVVVPSSKYSLYLRNMPFLNNAPLLRRCLKPLGMDVVLRPFTAIYPELPGVREVVIIADLLCEERPEYFSLAMRHSRKRMYRNAAVKADGVIATSNFMKQSIVGHYGVRPGKVRVIYEAAGKQYGRRIPLAERKMRLNELGIGFEYVYYPAAAWKHKNHEILFKAMKLLKERGSRLKLVLSGLGGNMAELREKARSAGCAEQVVILPRIEASCLPSLYQGAKLMAFPSLYEGFGLPLAEAIKSGCPVVCANVGSVPEICGKAAQYFDPHSPEDLAEKIWRVAHDERLRRRLIKGGRRQAAKFSWEKCAKETIAFLEEVGGS